MQESSQAKIRKTRPGVKRLLLHIIVFALLGLVLLGLGLYGYRALDARTLEQKSVVRVDAHLASAAGAVQELANSAEPGSERQVKTGIDSRKRKLKESIASSVAQGLSNEEIARGSVETLLGGVLKRVSDAEKSAVIAQAFQAGEDELVARIAAAVAAAEEATSLAKTRLSLRVTEAGYGLMYYYMPLLALGSFCLLFSGALLFAWLRYDERKRAGVGELLEPVDYLLPFFIGVAIFTLYPIVRVVIMSFQERYRLEGSFTGWGIGNYVDVINGTPGTTNYFLQGLGNTFLYVMYTVPISTALAIIIAYLLNQKLRLASVFQTSYFLPMVTSITAVGLVWRWIFNREFGVLNALLGVFGVDKINWLQHASHSMTVLVIFGIWSALPFTIILLLSGLQNIDDTFYTVAKVDGARQFRIFRRITLPLLSPTIGLVLIINSISAFKVFTEVNVLFNGTPGPVSNLYTVVYYIFDMLREKNELGRSAAAAIILFVFILLFTALQRFIQRKWKYD